jgi:hypothetical protein
MEDAIQQFRITTWPAQGLPQTRGLRPEELRLTPDRVFVPSLGAFALWDNWEEGIEDRLLLEAFASELPTLRADHERAAALADVGEIYLELATLDLEDDNAIAGFVANFGVLGVAHEHFAFFKSLPGFHSQSIQRLADAWPAERLGQSRNDYLEQRGATSYGALVETFEEFRFGARCVRDMLRAASLTLGSHVPARAEQAFTEEWLSIPAEQLDALRDEAHAAGVELTLTDEASDLFLRELLSEGLRPFHPRVIYANEAQLGNTHPSVPLYAICCLELFNHLAQHATYRQCANENCGRPFVHQRGRAEHGQHRGRGVRYCSSHCARAQAQRNYRRRASSPP